MERREIDFIIFDIDGTLIDSRQDISNVVNFTLKHFGLKEKSLEEVTSYIGTGVRDLIKRALGEEKKGLLKEALSVFQGYYRDHSTDTSILYPDVKEVLEFFKNKKKAIVTNRDYEFAVLSLKKLGIYGYFKGIVGGEDTGCMKPSSCPLNKLMLELKIDDKKKTMIVGDMDIDVATGKAAGIATCAVTYGIGKKEDIIKAKPEYMIDNLIDLKNIVK